MIEFSSVIADAFHRGILVRLVLSRRRGNVDGPERLTARPVTLRGINQLQLTFEGDGRQTHENLDAAAAAERIAELLGATFRHAHLFTTEADYSARVGRGGRVRVRRDAPTHRDLPSTNHDRPREYLLPEGTPCAFLEAIGVMTAAGRVRRSRHGKFRQVNRFLELVDDVLDSLPDGRTVEVIDFGCGKSYLTFALHHLLSALRKRDVRIQGLDHNQAIVDDCNGVAAELGLDDVTFRQGDIAGCQVSGPVDLAVSLHACDTATDDALARAISWRAGIILAVPCCQHELAGALAADPLAAVSQHGILHHRLAALVTDALRAEALEVCGYRTQVVEFIDLEHTAKNVLIRAVRRDDADNWPDPDQPHCLDRAAAYRQLRATVDLPTTRLESQFGSAFREFVARD